MAPFKGSREFTIFILNFPGNFDSFALGKLFQRFGVVNDVYIPKKVDRNTGQRFAFVRFMSKNAASKAVNYMDGQWLYGRKIRVYWARFQKPRKRFNQHLYSKRNAGYFNSSQPRDVWQPQPDKGSSLRKTRYVKKIGRRPTKGQSEPAKWEWRPKKIPTPPITTEELVNRNAGEKSLKEIRGSVCEENLEWLNRSIICVSSAPLEAVSLVEHLKAQLPALLKFTDMGKYKFLLTFGSQEIAKRVLVENKYFLDNWFAESRMWDRDDVCQSRRTWIELFGIPPLGWSYENITKIAELWGEVVYLNEDTIGMKSLEAACALIDTPHMKFVDDEITFHLEDKYYKVKALESRITVNTFSSGDLVDSSEENTISDPLVAHAEHSRVHDINTINDNDNDTVVADSLLGVDHNPASGSKGLEHSLSRTWSEVVKGRKRSPLKKVVSSEVQNDSHSVNDSITKKACEIYEFNARLGLKAKEGYEEVFIEKIEHNLRMERKE